MFCESFLVSCLPNINWFNCILLLNGNWHMCNVETLVLKTVHLKVAVVKIDVWDKGYIGPDVSGFACFFSDVVVMDGHQLWFF